MNTANKPEEKDKRRQQVNHSNNVSIFIALASQKSQIKISIVSTFVIIHRINTINRYVHFVVEFKQLCS